jgi:eukaryotic-like serine/threonine-protein kinase
LIEERVFNNRYRLDRKLGEGGMATVFCGTDIVLRRRVAIKVLREQYASDQEFVRRFYQEAESAARLSHPNIVNTYDVGHESGTYFIVMELVDGPSLAEILAADGRLPEPVAIDYAAQIASGLAYAHRMGLLHRDIKPANVLVTKDDVVKLSDFGIARAVSQHTMTLTKPGLVMGSVYYISPEQAQGHELHETSDLYSVGIVLYQMLTGKLPYTGESPVTVALRHISDPVPRIESKDIASPALSSIINKLLQKQPENRFQSASELATALREARERPGVAGFRIQDDAPSSDTAGFRATRSGRATLPPRRSPMPDRPYVNDDEPRGRGSGPVWAVLALIVVLLVATGAGYFLFGRPLPSFNANIDVGDYTNMTDAQAQQAVVNAGLRTRFVRTASDTTAQNHVIRQFPEPGTKVEKNAVIELVVSNGKPLVGLADVRGYLALDAQRSLQQDGFAVTIARRFDNTAKDNVIDEVPKPGTQVRQGSRVTLVVSNGPAPIVIPNFVGMSVESAQAQAQRLGITLDTSRQSAIPGYPADAVASQDVAAGTKVDKNTVVHAIVSSGAETQPTAVPAAQTSTAVPAVVGKAYQDALNAFDGTGFVIRVSYSTQTADNGYVIAEDPQPDTQLAQGSTVTLTVSVPGEVPDTEGMSVDTARSTLSAAGYGVSKTQYTTNEGAGGRVIGTDPSAGTNLPPGTAVTLIVNGTAPQSPR